MQAVILAAGRGRRLNGHANGLPKCMLRVGDRSLLQRQVDLLRGVGVDEVCVVVGHGAEHVYAALGDSCSYVVNARYGETNSLYSMWLARNWVRGPFLLANGDILVSRHVYRRVASAPGSALAYDSTSGSEAEHMKVVLRSGRLERIAKDVPSAHSHGESLGVLKFDRASARRLFASADDLIAAGRDRTWAPAAVDRIARRVPIRGVDVAGQPWTEIDFPEDLDAARAEVWPAIRCLEARPVRDLATPSAA